MSGDPVKFGLGFASMVFDTIFMLQHWVCFRGGAAAAVVAVEPLLDGVAEAEAPRGD